MQAKKIMCAMLLALGTLTQTLHLEADGWGKSENVEALTIDGVEWSEVFFDSHGLYFTASVPNYTGVILQQGEVYFMGSIDGNAYSILTTETPDFPTPDSAEEFLTQIQNDNPNYSITEFKQDLDGAKFMADLVPNNSNNPIVWRYYAAENHLIKMGTDDTNTAYREQFFQSLNLP